MCSLTGKTTGVTDSSGFSMPGHRPCIGSRVSRRIARPRKRGRFLSPAGSLLRFCHGAAQLPMGARGLGLAAILLALAGCPADQEAGVCPAPAAAPSEFVDTTKARFRLSCAEPKLCEVTSLAGAPNVLTCASRSIEQVHLLIPVGRVLRLCGAERAGDGYTVNAGFCRPVACTCETGCPWGRTCSNGICQIPSAPLLLEDVLALCAADVLWPATCEEFVSNYSAAVAPQMQAVASCPSGVNCKVPAACRQP